MKYWTRRALLILMLMPIAACQAETEKYNTGVDYEILPQPIRTHDPSKIEVNEVFSYHCGHCFAFESNLHPWSEKLAKDVDFQRTPAIWQPILEPFARAYYSAEALGVLDKVHGAFFEAYHVSKKIALRKDFTPGPDDFAEIAAANGVDKDKFLQAFDSFGVTSKVNQAKSRVRGYGSEGTPELIVDGKYRIHIQQAKSFENMLKIADFLIEKERAARSG